MKSKCLEIYQRTNLPREVTIGPSTPGLCQISSVCISSSISILDQRHIEA